MGRSVERIGGADVGRAVALAVRQYNDDVKAAIRKETDDAAKDVKRDVQAGSPEKSGRYRKGWKITKRDTANKSIRIVHNADVPGLPHLLEHGHANRGGGRTPGRPHIKPASDPRLDRMYENIKSIIKKGG